MGLRAWMLRRAMGRLRIDDDTVRHLSTFQRLGESVELQLPTEVLPVGARTVFRALRTRAAPQVAEDWVWPLWLSRQIDPRSPAFVPRGHLPFLTNVTRRNWTSIGNVSSPWNGVVDPAGLVTPWFDGWSLDWWIGADDRWHVPAREPSVRQGLVDNTPVVETGMRVPGGEAVHRVYAVAGADELAVVEVENRSPVPVVVAFAVRPYNPEGLAVIERIELHDRTVTVDGRPALLLPSRPRRMAASTFHAGDSAATVFAGDAGDTIDPGPRCEAGLAQAAFLFPLPHTATIRVAAPLVPARRTRRRGRARRRAERAPSLPEDVASSSVAARGWVAQTDRGLRLDLPPGRLADAVEANKRFLLLFHDGDEVTPGPATYHRFWFRDATYLLAAMGRFGFHDEVGQVLASYPRRQRVDGFFFSQRLEWDSNGAALHALAEHWRLTGRLDAFDGWETVVARAAHWIERKRSRRRRRDHLVPGLLPAGISAEHLGPHDVYFWDDFWSWRGLLDAAEMLAASGQEEAAARITASATSLGSATMAAVDEAVEHRGDGAIPAGPRRGIDHGLIGSLVATHPLGLLGADDGRIAATVETIRERFTIGPAFYQGISHTGLGTYLTLQLAFVELLAGDRRCLDRLAWMLDAATPTFTWPEAVHPQLGGGCMGDGHHGWAAAELLSFVRAMLVREPPPPATDDPELVLLSMVPDDWLGQPLEVHGAPTHHGLVSYAVRWHGERPALLWELEPHPGVGPVRLTAPGLDPTWSTTEPNGDALLAAPSRRP